MKLNTKPFAILSVSLLSFCAVWLLPFIILKTPTCSGLALLACGFFIVVGYPLILLATFLVNTALLSRFFLVKLAFIYAWISLAVTLGVTFLISHALSSGLFILATSLLMTLVLAAITQYLERTRNSWVIVISGLLLPIVIFSPWLWHDAQVRWEAGRQNTSQQSVSLHSLKFSPYVSSTTEALVISANGDGELGGSNFEAIKQPHIYLSYDNYHLHEYPNDKGLSGVGFCNSVFVTTSGQGSDNSSAQCLDKGSIPNIGTLAVYNDLSPNAVYLVGAGDVVIGVEPTENANDNSGNVAEIPSEKQVIAFLRTFKPVKPATLKPKG